MCYDADIGKGFLTRTQNVLIMKNDKWDFPKLKLCIRDPTK